MSARQAFQASYEARVVVVMGGDRLRVRASGPPPSEVLEKPKRHRAEVLLLLRRESASWSSENWQAHSDKPAGIAEHDGDLSPSAAEAQAYGDCLTGWIEQYPVRSSPEWCHGCDGREEATAPLLPYRAETASPI